MMHIPIKIIEVSQDEIVGDYICTQLKINIALTKPQKSAMDVGFPLSFYLQIKEGETGLESYIANVQLIDNRSNT